MRWMGSEGKVANLFAAFGDDANSFERAGWNEKNDVHDEQTSGRLCGAYRYVGEDRLTYLDVFSDHSFRYCT